MSRTLIVANRSVGGDDLTAAVKERLEAGGCAFHLVVPVASPMSSAVAIGAAAAEMMPTATLNLQNERELAQERLTYGLAWLESMGAKATGELASDADTASAVYRIVAEQSSDEVIVSTLPSTLSRWLRQDLPHRIERKVSVPVIVVTPNY